MPFFLKGHYNKSTKKRKSSFSRIIPSKNVKKNGEYTEIPSYALPEGFIKGTTGAGDAFCAGALLGIYLGKSDAEILAIASKAAVGALSAADAVSGMKSLAELEVLCAPLGFQSI